MPDLLFKGHWQSKHTGYQRMQVAVLRMADYEAMAEKARLYDEMQEQLAKIGTLEDARAAAAKAGRVRIEAEGYALEYEPKEAANG